MQAPDDHPLPPLYDGWVRALLGAGVPRETEATCAECAMCVQPDGRLPTSVYFFEPDIKCCVYLPRLPNFLVGGVLADDDPSVAHGRRTVGARVAARVAVTPLGLGRPPGYELLFRNSVNAIGRARALRCPHYVEEGGLCGMWRHRDAMCTTWFCRHVRGPKGASFWQGLRHLLRVVEGELARRCALELGIEAERLTPYLPATADDDPRDQPKFEGHLLDGRVDEEAYAELWGCWVGREEEYYRACAEKVAALSWPEVLVKGGSEVAVWARVVEQRFARLRRRELPRHVALGRFELTSAREGGVRAVSYSSLDAIDLPAALLPLLPRFDGRATDEVLAELAAEGVELSAELLQMLVDWGVVVAAD